MCQKAHVPMLAVALYDTTKIGASTAPNSEIDLSLGARDDLSKDELTTLIAHEVAHTVIKQKQIPTMNNESTADIIGAKLTSEKSMIHLIKVFSKYVNYKDKTHYSDKKRIAKIKITFKKIQHKKRYHKLIKHKKNVVNQLETKIKNNKSKVKKIMHIKKQLQITKLENKKLRGKLGNKKLLHNQPINQDKLNNRINHFNHLVDNFHNN